LDEDHIGMNTPPTPSGWNTKRTSIVYESKPWLTIEKHAVVTPDGRQIDDWHVIALPSFVNVLPRLEDGRFLLIRQNKYLCQPETLATIGGLIDPGETPLQAAERELLEESGCTSNRWQELGSYCIDPNRGCGGCYLFVAENCRRLERPRNPDCEQFGEILVTESELVAIAMGDQIKSVAWATCILKALLWLQNRQSVVPTS
jgi:ADP-ribose pyrophosphatase